MASPHASSFICLPFSDNHDVVIAYTVYFSACIGSALVGVAGSVLFLWQVLHSGREGQPGSSKSQKWILIMLAVSDLCAVIGVITRSCFWLIYWRPRHLNQDTDFSHLPPAIVGAVIEHWVFFWYLATYFWIFFFAVDVYNSKHGGKWKLFCSHLFTWLFSSLYVGGSAASLWVCTPYFGCAENKLCVISHFMCTLGPMIIIMAALPLFYLSTWKQMKKNAAAGPVVDIWKKEKEMSKRKILSLILVFYICWCVNVVDGLLLIIAHSLYKGPDNPLPAFYIHIYDSKYIYAIWLLEAVLNPLQGFLNALAYGDVLRSVWLKVCARCKTKEPCISSWSGEYIDVDFRVSRGKIHQSKRSKAS